MTGPDIHALAGAYALHAVDDVERAAFARHLAECDACTTEVAELQEAAAHLADGTWAAPPPGLRGSVLAEVSRTRQLPPGSTQPAPRAVSRWRRMTAAAVAAAVVAVGAGAVSTLLQQQRVRHEREAAQAAKAEAAHMQAVLSAPDVAMRTATITGGGHVAVVMSHSMDAGVAVLSELPAPPSGKAYQLWMMRADHSAVSAGMLAPATRGGRNLLEHLGGMTAFGVSVEPAAGSTAPTTQPIVMVPLV